MLSKFISLLKSYKVKKHVKSLSKYLEVGNSYFYNGFYLSINSPNPQKKYLKIGNNTILDCFISFNSGQGEVIIGNNTWIGNSQITCNTSVEIGDNVFLSWGGYISDHDSHSVNYLDRQNDIVQQLNDYRYGRDFLAGKNWEVVKTKGIKIHSNVWVGMNCIILKGVTIGEGAIIGAGSVVTKDVAPWTVVGGNPATFLKEIPEGLRKK